MYTDKQCSLVLMLFPCSLVWRGLLLSLRPVVWLQSRVPPQSGRRWRGSPMTTIETRYEWLLCGWIRGNSTPRMVACWSNPEGLLSVCLGISYDGVSVFKQSLKPKSCLLSRSTFWCCCCCCCCCCCVNLVLSRCAAAAAGVVAHPRSSS